MLDSVAPCLSACVLHQGPKCYIFVDFSCFSFSLPFLSARRETTRVIPSTPWPLFFPVSCLFFWPLHSYPSLLFPLLFATLTSHLFFLLWTSLSWVLFSLIQGCFLALLPLTFPLVCLFSACHGLPSDLYPQCMGSEKRSWLVADLRKGKTQIDFLQEMHLRRDSVPKLTNKDFSWAYHTPLPIL